MGKGRDVLTGKVDHALNRTKRAGIPAPFLF